MSGAGSAARLVAVNVVYKLRQGPLRTTAIDKRPVDEQVTVGKLGLAGDTQCDQKRHGGPDQALYAYASEDAAWWTAELGREIPPGLFGENLTTEGLDVTGALIGERWRIGSGPEAVEVEVRSPRNPCSNFASRMGIPQWVKRFTAHGAPGAYLKVLHPGVVAAGDPITVRYRPHHNVTIGHVFIDSTPQQMLALLDSGTDLAEELRAKAERIACRG